MFPTSPREAKEQGVRHYEGVPCKTCSGTIRFASSRGCVSCTKEKTRTRQIEAYGITREDYDLLRTRAGFRCEICGEAPESLCIDHDHTTGVVRGLLCRPCNLGLGDFRDSPERLRAAIDYLERSSVRH